MAVYTFYPCRSDGVSVTFSVLDLTSDDEAPAAARAILQAHPTCAFVEVWEGERQLEPVHAELATG